MSSRFRLTRKAAFDLFQIGRYTEGKWGRIQRDHYLKQLDDAFHLIAKNPEIGKDRSHVLAGYRSFQQGSHAIYYRQTEVVEIIRILHVRMDVEKWLK